MAPLNYVKCSLLVLFLVNLIHFGLASRIRKLDEYIFPTQENPLVYHNGEVLQGKIPVSIVWYGTFTPTQKYILTNFIESLTHDENQQQQPCPSVSQWFDKINQLYLSQLEKNGPTTHVHLDDKQIVDENYSKGKYLKEDQISELAALAERQKGEIAIVFTAEDVAVEGFCMDSCALHKSDPNTGALLIWVGNAATQCPGQCSWPFHQPIYGPMCPPLTAPNGDIGIDGMVINLAHMVAGTITNPSGNGFYQGAVEMPLEASTACPGVYANGHFPGYAGNLPTDSSGASYNANGANGQKYLLPAIFDPSTCSCTTMV
ncbi:Protein EXORDIUM [Rhynchospora pubera]|uniref:Protein EXORDIUM n=1 Tax=Rhynchospora pubera TaxID=906938 RepID=A0AAV8FA20_9POAL|nr:Protein EXORDIUM [Rhynchospora pubera]